MCLCIYIEANSPLSKPRGEWEKPAMTGVFHKGCEEWGSFTVPCFAHIDRGSESREMRQTSALQEAAVARVAQQSPTLLHRCKDEADVLFAECSIKAQLGGGTVPQAEMSQGEMHRRRRWVGLQKPLQANLCLRDSAHLGKGKASEA